MKGSDAMFSWFGGKATGSEGLELMRAEFGQMLDAGRHMFDVAANALLGGTDVEVIRQDLFDTDERINQSERQIRRSLVVHATVHGSASFPSCLVLMSVVKDAERVGDYAKNIFDLAELRSSDLDDGLQADLVQLKGRISQLMANCRMAFDTENADESRVLIREAEKIEDHCDDRITQIIRSGKQVDSNAVCALSYRYFKRTASHVRNVLTSVVQPIDLLDYTDSETSSPSPEV
jgi:Na+/phosphate symporter